MSVFHTLIRFMSNGLISFSDTITHFGFINENDTIVCHGFISPRDMIPNLVFIFDDVSISFDELIEYVAAINWSVFINWNDTISLRVFMG
jgi:hypothetical protein